MQLVVDVELQNLRGNLINFLDGDKKKINEAIDFFEKRNFKSTHESLIIVQEIIKLNKEILHDGEYILTNNNYDSIKHTSVLLEEQWKKLESLYKTNKIVSLETLLDNFTPREAEYLTAGFLKKIDGWENLIVTKDSRDEGIDIYGEEVLSNANNIRARVACQVKWYSHDRYVTGPELQSFIGSINSRGTKGIYVTTSSYTRDALEYSKDTTFRGVPIVCVNGKELVSNINEYFIKTL
jgi:restriction system protein